MAGTPVVIVAGPAIIKIAAPAAGTLDTLGYTRDGAQITEHVMTGDVPGDENGGDQGPPIDVQYFGEMHLIRCLLTKYDETIADKIRAGLAGGTAGTPGTSGSLYFQGTLAWRLLIHSTNFPRNYTRVVFQEPKEINKGTKFSSLMIVGRAYKDGSGVLFNATTS